MTKSSHEQGRRQTGRKRPNTSKSLWKRRASTRLASDDLTLPEIVREFGGTLGQWKALICAGKLAGARHRVHSGLMVRRSLVQDYVARATRRALAKDAPAVVPPPNAVLRVRTKPLLLPGIEHRRKVAYIKGTSVPARRLARALHAGSTEADLHAAFPELPPRAILEVTEFTRKFPANTPGLKDIMGPAQVSAGEDVDSGAGFEEELEALMETHAELFRRLAQ